MSEIFKIECTKGPGSSDHQLVAMLLNAVQYAIVGVGGIGSWRFVFEDIRVGAEEPYLSMELISIAGSEDDNARAKIATLKRHADIFNTGDNKEQSFYCKGDVLEYGAIRVPYIGYVDRGSDDDGFGRVDGNVYLSFSGAHEYVNIAVVVSVFSSLLEYRDNDDKTLFQYDTSGLLGSQLISHMVGTIPFWF